MKNKKINKALYPPPKDRGFTADIRNYNKESLDSYFKKNCFLCGYHIHNKDSNTNIFCRFLRKDVNSIEAIKCGYFMYNKDYQNVNIHSIFNNNK